MASSMTGFGTADAEGRGHKIRVEINTVNSRFLEYQVRLPKSVAALESQVKNLLAGLFHRGKILVMVNWERESGPEDLVLDEVKTQAYLKIYELLKEKFGIEGEISFRDFVALPDLVRAETEENNIDEIWTVLKPALTEAAEAAVQMREVEGKNLVEDMRRRISTIGTLTGEIEDRASQNVDGYRQKLKSRIQELLDDKPVDEQRIAQEVAMFAEKADIAEECIRLRSHLSQFAESLREEGPVGKRLNFILQELNREANTIASKSADYEISRRVIAVKEDIERLREQVQNIE
jgi:uncharacterized protein (TIGR00255 family)